MNVLTEQITPGTELTTAQIQDAAEKLLDESVAAGGKAEFLKTLAGRGETPAEIAAFVDAFLSRAVDPQLTAADVEGPLLDVCGTGGDKLNLFNVSTTCIFVLAAAGIAVVKHGNRGITSKSGGADVLEALGIRIDKPPQQFVECVKRTGLGFLFAPMYHPAFKAVVPVRKELAAQGVRTVFNILGPLLNPVRPDYQLVGVFSPELPPVFADILSRLGRQRAWAVHGTTADGRSMDELSTQAKSHVAETENGTTRSFEVDPAALGLTSPSLEDLQGGDARENAHILHEILEGKEQAAKRDIVLLNSAAGLCVAGKATGLSEGLNLAAHLIDSGKALEKLRAFQAFSAEI